MAVQLLILALLLVAVPMAVGSLWARLDRWGRNLIFRWISGQFLLWAGFQLICVPMILWQMRFDSMVALFLGYTGILLLLAAAMAVKRRKCGEARAFQTARGGEARSFLLWAVFAALLLFQLVRAVGYVYVDSDDAYYVAVASIAENSDTMYQVLPYTGGGTQLDSRHALAPFSMWIAFLARLSGMRTVAVAQTVLPVVLISMAYGVYYLFSLSLFPGRGGQRALFLIFTELLVLFGNYSIYTSETFLIGRSRQGKASLGSIVIPFFLFLLLELLKKLQEDGRMPAMFYLLAGAVTVSGCLCSTLGTLLVCVAAGACGLFGAVCYKKPKILLPLIICCLPCVAYAFLYILMD